MILIPGSVNALNINEYPPYVNVKNEDLYNVEKILHNIYNNIY